MDTYLSLNKQEWEDIYYYNKEEGKVYNRVSDTVVGSITPSGLVVKRRIDNKVISVSLGRLCYFLINGVALDHRYFVKYYDKDIHNLKPDNLYVTKDKEHSGEYSYAGRQEVVPVDRNIIYNPNSNMFVVRRLTNQSIYRCSSLEEAISIRNEWELDNSIHKWDKSVGKYQEYLSIFTENDCRQS
jgi:hypothetical protein